MNEATVFATSPLSNTTHIILHDNSVLIFGGQTDFLVSDANPSPTELVREGASGKKRNLRKRFLKSKPLQLDNLFRNF